MKYVKFQWDDPLNLDAQLTPLEREVQGISRSFAENKLMPRVLRDFKEERYDPAILKEMGDLGLLGASFKGFGCKGWNHVSYGLIARELERIDSGYRTLFSVQSSLAMHAIYLFGSESQKEKYLPGMARGLIVGAFGVTEPQFGSDPSSMATEATPVNSGFFLNGSKKWIGLAAVADVIVVWAKDSEKTIRGFLVEKGTEGLKTQNIQGKLSLRCAPTSEIHLKDVFVPEDGMLPKAQGIQAPFSCMNMARYAISWGAFGAAESCWHIARDYAMNRKQFGHPIAASQLIQKKLTDMQTEIALGFQGCLRLGRLLDEKKASFEMISMMKRHATMKAQEIARNARDILGANGILDEYHVMRHMVNLEAVSTYEGTADIHALVLGRAQTGISAF